MIKIGLIGMGKMGANHARVLSETSGVEFIGYFDPKETESDLVARRYSSESELVDDCDALIVASPSSHHVSHAELILGHGKSCLIEKPLATTMEEIQRIKKASGISHGRVFVGMVERFNPAVAVAKKVLNEGTVGEVHQISSVRQGPRPNRIKDVGVDLDLAVHDLDLGSYLGKAKIESISVERSTIENDSIFPDYFLAVGRLGNGVRTSHQVNWRHPIKRRTVTIFGSNAVLELDLLNFEVRIVEFGAREVAWPNISHSVGPSRGRVTDLEVTLEEPLSAEIKAFVKGIEDPKKTEICNIEQAEEILKWILQ